MKSWRNISHILVLHILCVPVIVDTICIYKTCVCSTNFDNTVTCSNLWEIPTPEAGSDITRPWIAVFNKGYLTSISTKNLPSGLIKLEFNDNPLTNLTEDAFQSSANTLNSLSITNAKFNKLPDALLTFTTLSSLTIADTFIVEWNDTILQKIATNIATLKLINVGLKTWPSWFSYFNHLFEVDLSRNSLQFVPDDAFSNCKMLMNLALDNCNLTQLPKALSFNFNLLDHLDLSNNILIEIDGRPAIEKLTTFPCGSTLTLLTMKSAGLTVMPQLSNMTSLGQLILSNNQIENPTTNVTNLFPPRLWYIDLNGNKLTSLPPTLASLTQLNFLYLASNQIAGTISIDQFPVNVTYVDLSNNKITNITDLTSTNTSRKLQSLTLSGNPISTISRDAFRGLDTFYTLDLVNTSLSQLPLALTSLNKITGVSFSAMPCLCPTPVELVDWFKSRDYSRVDGKCSNDRYIQISDYLKGKCISAASNLVHSSWSSFGCLILLLTAHLYF